MPHYSEIPGKHLRGGDAHSCRRGDRKLWRVLFKAQTGKYCVYLKQDWRDEYCVGDIAVYDDSKPGTLNDFLTAIDEGDLKPDVVKRFEEMVAQAQQSAETATESERQAGQHADAAARAKEEVKNWRKVFSRTPTRLRRVNNRPKIWPHGLRIPPRRSGRMLKPRKRPHPVQSRPEQILILRYLRH